MFSEDIAIIEKKGGGAWLGLTSYLASLSPTHPTHRGVVERTQALRKTKMFKGRALTMTNDEIWATSGKQRLEAERTQENGETNN